MGLARARRPVKSGGCGLGRLSGWLLDGLVDAEMRLERLELRAAESGDAVATEPHSGLEGAPGRL